MSKSPLHIAMWSGPRNISTALMRSWGNRPDTCVCDEPFYAFYLAKTRKPHPGLDEIIAAGEPDAQQVVNWLTGPVPEGKRIFYQKHMTHHLLPEAPRAWLGQVTNCFLIRHPREMLTSYIKIVDQPTFADTGFPQQLEIFNWVREHQGIIPPVIDSVDVLNEPQRMLGLLCAALNLEFLEAMLSWPPGPRTTDGVWARYWYKEVETTTSFRPYQPKNEPLPPALEPLYAQCLHCYEELYAHRLH